MRLMAIFLSFWLIVTGSSAFGHILRLQSGPKWPKSQEQTPMLSLSQLVY